MASAFDEYYRKRHGNGVVRGPCETGGHVGCIAGMIPLVTKREKETFWQDEVRIHHGNIEVQPTFDVDKISIKESQSEGPRGLPKIIETEILQDFSLLTLETDQTHRLPLHQMTRKMKSKSAGLDCLNCEAMTTPVNKQRTNGNTMFFEKVKSDEYSMPEIKTTTSAGTMKNLYLTVTQKLGEKKLKAMINSKLSNEIEPHPQNPPNNTNGKTIQKVQISAVVKDVDSVGRKFSQKKDSEEKSKSIRIGLRQRKSKQREEKIKKRQGLLNRKSRGQENTSPAKDTDINISWKKGAKGLKKISGIKTATIPQKKKRRRSQKNKGILCRWKNWDRKKITGFSAEGTSIQTSAAGTSATDTVSEDPDTMSGKSLKSEAIIMSLMGSLDAQILSPRESVKNSDGDLVKTNGDLLQHNRHKQKSVKGFTQDKMQIRSSRYNIDIKLRPVNYIECGPKEIVGVSKDVKIMGNSGKAQQSLNNHGKKSRKENLHKPSINDVPKNQKLEESAEIEQVSSSTVNEKLAMLALKVGNLSAAEYFMNKKTLQFENVVGDTMIDARV